MDENQMLFHYNSRRPCPLPNDFYTDFIKSDDSASTGTSTESSSVFTDDNSLLHCTLSRPVPLSANFYKCFLDNAVNEEASIRAFTDSSDFDERADSFSSESKIDTARIVEEIMKSNEALIAESVMKQAAAAVINQSAVQFENLLPLSFDQEEFIRQCENGKKNN